MKRGQKSKKREYIRDVRPQVYADKQTRKRLCFKSIVCFNERYKWHKLCRQLGLSAEEIEIQMDEIINIKSKQQEKLIEEANRYKERSEQTENGPTTDIPTDGSSPSTNVRSGKV